MWTLCNACRERKKKISKRGCYGDVQLRGFSLSRVAHGGWDKRISRGNLCNDERYRQCTL